MSYKTAKDQLTALAEEGRSEDLRLLAESLFELARSIQSDLSDIKRQISALESKVNRLR